MQSNHGDFALKPLGRQDVDFAVKAFLAMTAEIKVFNGGQRIVDQLWKRFSPLLVPCSDSLFENFSTLKSVDGAFLVEAASEAVGLGMIRGSQERDGSAEILGIVASEHRRGGIGTWLVERLVQIAAVEGFSEVWYLVAPGARSSKSVGERTGFRARELKMFREINE